MTPGDLEPTLRHLRLADPSPELRRRILDACAARSSRPTGGAAWVAWRPELALAASVALLLAAVLAAGSPTAPPPAPTTPAGLAAAHAPAELSDDDQTLPLLAAAGPMVVPWPVLPNWPPEIPRIEERLARELEPPLDTASPRGEPPC